MPIPRALPCGLAAVLLLAACGDPAGPDADLTRADAEALATELHGVAAGVMEGSLVFPSFSTAGGGGVLATVTRNESFTRTVQCPGGGNVEVQGRVTSTVDHATRTATRVTEATRVENACVVSVRDGATMTLNGAPSTAMRAEHGVANGVPGKHTMTQKGAFTWKRSTGQSGTCSIDVVSVHDPATRTSTVNGTVCGRTVSVTRTRP